MPHAGPSQAPPVRYSKRKFTWACRLRREIDVTGAPERRAEGAEGRCESNDAHRWRSDGPLYAALDLGTNNCRLLVAKRCERQDRQGADNLRVVDAFSRIVRLGEGLSNTGRLGEQAMRRTLDALLVCREKIQRRGVRRTRLIATEACRAAANGPEFVARAEQETGLKLEIIGRETEARLAAIGCGSLADPAAVGALLFDIGGGSTEIIWLTPGRDDAAARNIQIWTSIEIGVVSLAERFGGQHVDEATFEAMVATFAQALAPFAERAMRQRACGRFHLLGTSGTVTTVAGVHLGLERYDRRRVDGLWMTADEADAAVAQLRVMNYEQRAANGCIGRERADLVLAGCAILEAIRRAFPAERLRIADRGLREGVLLELMRADRPTGMYR
ncbi:MAG: Ppx/GppA family phosphatase [Hyphomicrobiales bacterium]|nr:Ppx/GppA family phosphatase [Hyphomicrobiales bacterium]